MNVASVMKMVETVKMHGKKEIFVRGMNGKSRGLRSHITSRLSIVRMNMMTMMMIIIIIIVQDDQDQED